MGLQERDIIVHRPDPPESVITIELVDALKPVGQALPDQTPLLFVNLLSVNSPLTRRERQALFQEMGNEQMVESLKAWESTIADLTREHRRQITFSLNAVLRACPPETPPTAITVGTLRHLEIETLQAVQSVGPLRAAFLKEVFESKEFETGEEGRFPPVSQPPF